MKSFSYIGFPIFPGEGLSWRGSFGIMYTESNEAVAVNADGIDCTSVASRTRRGANARERGKPKAFRVGIAAEKQSVKIKINKQ